jgi:hypothetical protein
MDLDAVLDSATTDAPKKKKSNVPQVAVGESTKQKIKTWLNASREIDLATAKKKSVEEDLVVEARAAHQVICKKDKAVNAAVRLVADDGDSLQIDVAKDQYKKINKSVQAELKQIFSVDMEDCFTSNISVELTPAALQDKEILTKLIKAVGQENFKEYFKVEQTLKPTKKLHEGRFLDPKLEANFKQAQEAKLIEPYSASVKE